MASLVDVFVQSKTTTVDVPTSTSKDEGIKETPSLFDSLLSDSTKKLEKPQEEVKVVESKTPEKKVAETNILSTEEKNISKDLEGKIEDENIEKKQISTQDIHNKKAKKTISLLDRLIIEAKGEISSEEKIISKNSLDKASQNLKKDENNLNLASEKTEEIINTTISDESINTENSTDIIIENNSENNISENIPEEEKNIINPDLLNESEIKEEPIINDKVDLKKEDKNLAVTDNVDIKIQVQKEDNKEKEIDLKKEDLETKDNKQEIKIEKIQVDSEQKLDNKILSNSSLDEINIVTNKDNSMINNVDTSNAKDVINNLLVTDENEVLTTQTQVENKVETKKSLMDYLIEKNSQKNISDDKNIIKTSTIVQEQNIVSDDFVSSIYLGEQKNSMVNQFLFNKNEALKLLQNGSISLEDIEKSASILDLGIDDVTVEQDGSLQTLKNTKQDVNINDEKKNILDSMLSEKNIRSADIKNLITQSVEASKALLDNTLNVADDVTVDISPSLLNNIQSRIIGAKQQMSQMMSDVARQMYENYKPPVTVFKINLNPVELGNISILMKNDKNNSLSISMSVSNMTTLDTLLDNQNLLRNSLSKTFNENTQFNLDFSSSNQNNRGNEQQSSNKQNRKFEDKIDTQSVLKLKEENKDRDDSLDYM